MTTPDRYHLLGLGRARSSWLGDVAQWATSGIIPVDFSKCVSSAELSQRLSSMQRFSALLVDATAAGLDRDLISRAFDAGVPTLIIDDNTPNFDHWIDLGAVSVLSSELDPSDLLLALSIHASPVGPNREVEIMAAVDEFTAWTGQLIAVCGPGGTGVSSTAIAIAEGLAKDALDSELVLLADLARHGEQAMLHNAGDVMPGVEEVVEAHRMRRATSDEIRSMTFAVPDRGYQLLLGTRRSTAWSSLPPKAVETAITGLRRSFRAVVADITADFEGESDGGSVDVEERNTFARATVRQADLVVVVGNASMKGIHSLARTVRSVRDQGVDGNRILTIVNRAPKSALAKAEMTSALTALLRNDDNNKSSIGPIFIADKPVDKALRDGIALPKQFVTPISSAVLTVLSQTQPLAGGSDSEQPQAIKAGSLGIVKNAANH